MKLMNRRKSGGTYGRSLIRTPKGEAPVIPHFVKGKNNV